MKKTIYKKLPVALGIILGVGIIFGLVFTSRPGPELDSEINLFFWGNQTDAPVRAKNFEKEFGVKVNLYDFSSESNMVEILKRGNIEYDVVGVSDVYIDELIKEGLVLPINKKNLPNLRYIKEKFLDLHFNSENLYMVPLVFGTSGLLINTKYIPEDTNSWGILWNPEYAKKITLQDNRNGVFMVALKYIGYPVLAQSRFQLLEAKNFLFDQRPLLRGYENQVLIGEDMVAGELWAAHLTSTIAKQSIAKNKDLKYIIPEEGSHFWVVGLAIPTGSRNKYTAEVFINYILKPEVSAEVSNYYRGATCSEAAEQFVDKEILEDTDIYPTEDILKNLESFADYEVTDEILTEMEKIWKELNEGVVA